MNITRACLDKNFAHKTAPLYQYDYGQKLVFTGVDLPYAYEVHFSNQDEEGTAKVRIGTSEGVEIPDEYLLSGEPIYVWVFLHTGESDGETEYKTVIPVHKRAQVEDVEPTPVQQDVITETIAALQSAVAKSDTNVTHYPKIEDDTWRVWDAEANDWADTEVTATGPQGEQGIQGETGVGISGITFNPDYTLTITLDDGSEYTTDSIRGMKGETGDVGPQGETGNGIASATLNSNYTLTLRFTDGTSYTTPSIRGERGPQGIKGDTGATGQTGPQGSQGERGEAGNGIRDVIYNSNYTITIVMDDDTRYTTESLRGATGAKGDTGNTGPAGATGNGIASTVLNSNYTLTITFTDGTSYTTPSIRGEKGEAGSNGQDGHTPVKGTDYWTAQDKAEIVDDVLESQELSDALDSKLDSPSTAGTSGQVLTSDGNGGQSWEDVSSGVSDVQIDGTSVVTNSVAEIPVAGVGRFGVVQVTAGAGGGININPSGGLLTYKAPTSEIKGGTTNYKPIVPSNQHESTFYGLAKAAGDTTQSSSNNSVGIYTDDAKIAIQKMLGIYQAPWELIREDTFTNDTEADHFVTVDSDGLPFELTDIIVMFETPTQNTDASKGKYGQIHIYRYGQSGSPYVQLECGAWTQTAGSAPRGCAAVVEQKDGLLFSQSVASTSTSNRAAINYRYTQSFATASSGIFMPGFVVIFNKVGIPAVTGTGHYKIYGKRKWQ